MIETGTKVVYVGYSVGYRLDDLRLGSWQWQMSHLQGVCVVCEAHSPTILFSGYSWFFGQG